MLRGLCADKVELHVFLVVASFIAVSTIAEAGGGGYRTCGGLFTPSGSATNKPTFGSFNFRLGEIYGPKGPLFDPRNWARIILEYAVTLGLNVDSYAELRFVATKQATTWYLLIPIKEAKTILVPVDESSAELTPRLFQVDSQKWLNEHVPIRGKTIEASTLGGLTLRSDRVVNGIIDITHFEKPSDLGKMRGLPHSNGREVPVNREVDRNEFEFYWSDNAIRQRWKARLDLAERKYRANNDENLFDARFEQTEFAEIAAQLGTKPRESYEKVFHWLRSRSQLEDFLVEFTQSVRDSILSSENPVFTVPSLDGLASLTVIRERVSRSFDGLSSPLLLTGFLPGDTFVKEFGRLPFFDFGMIHQGHDPFGHLFMQFYLMEMQDFRSTVPRLLRTLRDSENLERFERLVDRGPDHLYSPHYPGYFRDLGLVYELGLAN